jgi:hypothetical protein
MPGHILRYLICQNSNKKRPIGNKKQKIIKELTGPSSSVSIVSGYRLDDRAIEVRSPAEAKGFFL